MRFVLLIAIAALVFFSVWFGTRRRMGRSVLLVLGAAVVGALLCTSFLPLICGVFLAPAALLAGLLCAIIAKTHRRGASASARESSGFARAARAGLVCFGLAVVFDLSGMFCGVWLESRSRDWCERLVPRLDAWREAHGTYPARLDDLGPDVGRPWLWDAKFSYEASDTEFSFDIPAAQELIFPVVYSFTSTRRTWVRYD